MCETVLQHVLLKHAAILATTTGKLGLGHDNAAFLHQVRWLRILQDNFGALCED